MNSLPQLPPRRRTIIEVERPNLGLYLDRPPEQVPDRAVSDACNVRVQNGEITSANVGYESFVSGLGGHVLMIEDFIDTSGGSTTIFGTKTDVLRYDTGSSSALFITPTYTTGTVAITNGSAVVTGTGTTWSTNLKSGDYFHVGSSSQNTTTATWYEIDSVDSNTQITLTTNVTEATASGQAYTVRLTFTATDSDYWNADVFPEAPLGSTSGVAAGDHFFATNGSELIVWDGSATTVTVLATETTGLAFTCVTVDYYKNMMIYGYVVESGTAKPASFKNSAIGDPENVTTAEANEFIVAEGVDFISAVMPLRDQLIFYCENSINSVQFVGTPTLFAIRTVEPGIGVYSGRTIVDFGGYHEFLGQDQGYRFDGNRLEAFGDHVFPEILRRADRSRASKAVAAISEEFLEVYWVIPLSTDNVTSSTKSAEVAYTEHYKENVGRNPIPFMNRDLPATALGFFTESLSGRFSDYSEGFDEIPFAFDDRFFTSNFPVMLFGDENGEVFKLNTADGYVGDTLRIAHVTTPNFRLVDGEVKGIVRKVEPFFEKNPTTPAINITVTTSNRVDGSTVESEVGTFEVDHSGGRFKSARAPGRYANVKFSNFQAFGDWSISGYKITVDQAADR